MGTDHEPTGLSIQQLKGSKNIAELLSDQRLDHISHQVITGYDIDDQSRDEAKDVLSKAMDIAKQTHKSKNTPWPNASNVKYPLITKAVIDYSARSYPAVIQGNKVVYGAIAGFDAQNVKSERAARVAKFMNWDLLEREESWEEGFDKLLSIYSFAGTAFKKIYYNPLTKRNVSDVCHPDKVAVNNHTQSLESAARITHLITFSKNDLIERMRAGTYTTIDVDELSAREADEYGDGDDKAKPLEFLEQHCYLDLDDDGYQEPYVVIVHKPSKRVLRIVNRFEKVHKNAEGIISRIDPVHYFVDYHFIRSPDGSFYSLGLGALLYSLNESINTLLNQLIDAGTLSNRQGGLIGRGLRLKNGALSLKLGEWKILDAASGTNIAQNVFPIPTKEPSATLFKLLGLLIEMGKDLISSNDATEGSGQTQNVATGTLNTMLAQGLKVYNAVSKRLHRSLKKEFRRLYKLHKDHLSPDLYKKVLDTPQADKTVDFGVEDLDILPVADPELSSSVQRVTKAQMIAQVPGVVPHEASKEMLSALQIDPQRIETLLPAPDPKADPPADIQKLLAEVGLISMKTKLTQIEAQILSEGSANKAVEMEIKQAETEIKQQDAQVRAEEAGARIHKMGVDSNVNESKAMLSQAKADQEASLAEAKQAHVREKDSTELSIKAADTMTKAAVKSSK